MQKDILSKVEDLIGDENKLLYLCKFGSHLYGTDTENSDTDYKGIFLPSKNSCYLGTASKNITYKTGDNDSKNTKDDVDVGLWSLQYFLKLVSKGETNALDLLYSFTHKDCVIYMHDGMKDLFANHRYLYNIKDCDAYTGYAISQARKYGVKGDRIGVLKDIYKYLSKLSALTYKLGDFAEEIIEIVGESSFLFKKTIKDKEFLIVCGKCHELSIDMAEFCSRIEKEYARYGERVKLAEENKGIDWKAISHAVRALYQMRELIITGKINYPLKDASYILNIKQGRRNWRDIEDVISNMIEEINDLLKNQNKQ